MSDTQTVVDEPDGQVTPAPEEVVDAQEEKVDLDALLASIKAEEESQKQEQPTQDDESQSAEAPKEDMNDVLSYVRGQMAKEEEVQRAKISEEYKQTVKQLKGDLPIAEPIVDAFLRYRADQDPRILKAYQFRSKDQKTWDKVITGLRGELRQSISNIPDQKSTSTREAVASAIQSAKSTVDGVVEKPFSQMSDAEFFEYQNKLINS